MQLYIIRHAQSMNNAMWAATGSEEGRDPDPELTEIGHRQARRLAQALAELDGTTPLADERDRHNRRGYGLTHVYTSLMRRALDTGHAIAEAVGLPLLVWREIHEWGGIYGRDAATGEQVGLPGVRRSDLDGRYGRLVMPEWLDEKGWWNRPFEPREETRARAATFWQALLARHGGTDDRVALVTHGGFTAALLQTLLRFKPQTEIGGAPRDIWFVANNASISRIDVTADVIRLVYLNRVDHLPPELIT